MTNNLRNLENIYMISNDRGLISSFKHDRTIYCDSVIYNYQFIRHNLNHDFNYFKELYVKKIDSDIVSDDCNPNILDIDSCFTDALHKHTFDNDFFNQEFLANYRDVLLKHRKSKVNKLFQFSQRNRIKNSRHIIFANANLNIELPNDIMSVLNAIKYEMLHSYKDTTLISIYIQKLVTLLRYNHNNTFSTITRLTGVTKSQYKNAIRNHKNGKLDNMFNDNRGIYRKTLIKRTPEIVAETLKYIETVKQINIKNVINHINSKSADNNFSYSTIKRILKLNLKASYRTLSMISQSKNTEKVKIYTKYFAKLLIKEFNSNSIIISVDETSFATTTNKVKQWTIESSTINFSKIKPKTHKSYTLLMAISTFKVEGYYLIEGSSNQIFFANFFRT